VALGGVAVTFGLLFAALMTPVVASAEPLCTDTWVGGMEGSWQTAAGWSTGKVPASSDVACIGAGNTVKVTEGIDQAGVVQGEGGLRVSGGTLEVSNVLEASKIKTLKVTGGTLTGGALLTVTASFVWEGTSTISGTGSLVLAAGVTVGEINAFNSSSESMTLDGRTLVNEGKLKFGSGTLYMNKGARVENKATFEASSEQEKAPSGAAIEAPSGSEGPASMIVNAGNMKKLEGATTKIAVLVENNGSVNAGNGTTIELIGGGSSVGGSWAATGALSSLVFAGVGKAYSLVEGSVSGPLNVVGAAVTMEGVAGTNAKMRVSSGSLSVATGSMTVKGLSVTGGTFTGAGTLTVTESFLWEGTSTILGSGMLVIGTGVSGGNIKSFNEASETMTLDGHTIVNEGQVKFWAGTLYMTKGAKLQNKATFEVSSSQEKLPSGAAIERPSGSEGAAPLIVNTGRLFKNEGSPTKIAILFENKGVVEAVNGTRIEILDPVLPPEETQYGALNPSEMAALRSMCGDPVDCVTGNFTETQTDLAVDGRGVGLDLTRAYNAQSAAKATSAGMFGYGWTSSFSDRLVVEGATHKATVFQANGSTVPFTEAGGVFSAPSWSGDTLTGSAETGYTLTLADQTKYAFNGTNGRLESETDRNGNQTTLSYDETGRLTTIADSAGRKITLTYNAGGQVETAKDPMGHVAKYAYESGNLTSVTLSGKTSPNWRFKYDASHRVTLMTDGRGGETTNTYDSSSRVTVQKDPLGHVTKFEYLSFATKITNEATGAVTLEQFDSSDLVTSITHGYGTANATTTKTAYNEANEPTSLTDGNSHTTTYEYDSAGNKLKAIDPEGHETKWTYNGTHDVLTMTTPAGETTTIERDTHGNPLAVSRPAPGATTQIFKYAYDAHGQLESATDPLERTWKYEYDMQGDRTAEIDPEGEKRTRAYNEDSQETSTVSPRGNVEGGEPAKYTTNIERDPQGRPVKVTDPLGHETRYSYDVDGNLTAEVDANGRETKTTYDADSQPIKVTEPDGTIRETGYDGAGALTSQSDGNKHVTNYKRDVLEQVTEIVDPLLRKTIKTYDTAGNLATVKDASGRTTTYTYDKADQLTKIAYSDGITPSVEYEYDKDGNRTSMTDGTGKTTYTYDQLDRLTESKDGHGDLVKYEYDLANQRTKITYPNGKTVERTYDKTGRMASIKDWLEHTINFGYDPNSNLTTTTLPTGTSETDHYAYNEADQQTEAKMTKSEETLASLTYMRDKAGQLTKTLAKGLPGVETTEYAYDENERLAKAGAGTYEYDAADNPAKVPGATNTFDAADELTEATGAKYSYDEEGERTKAAPTSGPATTYAYDQAGRLTSVTRPEEGETPKIEDSYAYNGDGQRTSQTVTGKTSYIALDPGGRLPMILNDGANSYIYGPASQPVEQIDSEEKALFLHHDQQTSTRMLTDTTGTVKATMTYDAYGKPAGSTGTTTTPLGYDGQYTNTDTGLLDLRARSYDPSTAQFTRVDPLAGLTLAPYSYVNDNPLNASDPTGLCGLSSFGDFGDCFDPTSSGNLAYKGAEALKKATGGEVDLPWLLTRPTVVDGAALLDCAAPFGVTDAACPALLAAAWSDSTSAVIAQGIETSWCDPANLAAKETVEALLLTFGGLGGRAAASAAEEQGAPALARLMIRGGPVATQGLLDAARR
jgi:RHS repeat-associated protein